jgi:site-specific DNA recombinase
MKDLKKPLVILMARVSSKQQKDKGFSIPAQLKKLRAYVAEKSLSIHQTFEIDETASKSNARIQFSKLMDLLESARKTDQKYAVLVEKFDRLTRNLSDADELNELCEGDHLEIHFVGENRVWKKGYSCHEWFVQNILTVASVYQNKHRSEEVAKGKREKLEQGGYPGFAPVGYKNQNANAKNRVIIADPDQYDLVKKCLTEIYPTCKYSLREMVEKMESMGVTNSKGKPLTLTGVRKMITRLFYTGYFEWAGEIWSNKGVDGDREPSYPIMITKAQYDRNQTILEGHCVNKKRKARVFNFRGLLTCVCGRTYQPHLQKDKVYHNCSRSGCGTVGFTEEELQKLFLDQLDFILPDEKAMTDLAKKLGEEVEILKEKSQDKIIYLKNRNAELDRKINRLYDRYDKEEILEDVFNSQYKRFTAEREENQAKLEGLEETRHLTVDNTAEILKLTATTFKDKYLESHGQGDFGKCNDMLKLMFKTVEVRKKDEHGYEVFPLHFLYNEPFNSLYLDGLDKRSRESETPFFEGRSLSYNSEL